MYAQNPAGKRSITIIVIHLKKGHMWVMSHRTPTEQLLTTILPLAFVAAALDVRPVAGAKVSCDCLGAGLAAAFFFAGAFFAGWLIAIKRNREVRN